MIETLESPDINIKQNTHIGPGRVIGVSGNRIRISLPDCHVWATMALAYQYQPIMDDILLVIGQQDSWYVIGVIKGKGKTILTASGNLEIRAPQGGIDMIAANGIRLKGPEVKLITKKLELIAQSVFESFVSVHRRIKEALHLRAGRVHITVDETHRVKAKKIIQRAKDDVKIDGRKVHLG